MSIGFFIMLIMAIATGMGVYDILSGLSGGIALWIYRGCSYLLECSELAKRKKLKNNNSGNKYEK